MKKVCESKESEERTSKGRGGHPNEKQHARATVKRGSAKKRRGGSMIRRRKRRAGHDEEKEELNGADLGTRSMSRSFLCS